MQPAQLLKHFGVVGIALKHTAIGTLSGLELFLLLVHMTNLKPNILFC